MKYETMSSSELIKTYGDLIREMKSRGIIRSKNIVGDFGEHLVVEFYTKSKILPKLQFAPPSTKNIDAISINGERYSIKTTTGNLTGAFYGISKDIDKNSIRPLFEYVVVVKLDDFYQPELILEVDWDIFMKHKHWHTRVQAYNLLLTKSLIADSRIIFQK